MRTKLLETTEVKVLLNTLQGINYTYLFFRISFQIGLMFELLMFECLRALNALMRSFYTHIFNFMASANGLETQSNSEVYFITCLVS